MLITPLPGNLHFSHVLQEDSVTGNTRYACAVHNSALKRTQQGSYNIIRPQGGKNHFCFVDFFVIPHNFTSLIINVWFYF